VAKLNRNCPALWQGFLCAGQVICRLSLASNVGKLTILSFDVLPERKQMMRIAVIGGDGTGPEVVSQGLKVLGAVSKKIGFGYTTKDFNVSGDRYLK